MEKLLDRYLQAVKYWLPKKQQDDIIAELREDIRSEMDDRAARLGRSLTEGEASAILKKRGQPMVVAGRYLPQRPLIGPALMPSYWRVLRIVILYILVPLFLLVGASVIPQAKTPVGAAVWMGWQFWSTMLAGVGTITIIFAVWEWRGAKIGKDDWEPRDLPPVRPAGRMVPRSESIAEMVVDVLLGFGLVAVLRWHLFKLLLGAYVGPYRVEPRAIAIILGATLPILAAQFLVAGIVAVRPWWTQFWAASRLIISFVSLAIVGFVLSSAPWISAAGEATDYAHVVGVAAVLNRVCYYSLVCTGLFIVGQILGQIWRLIRIRRESLVPRTS